MDKNRSFFSMEMRPRRILEAAAGTAVCSAGVLLLATGKWGGLFVGVFILVLTGHGWLSIWARRRPMPSLAPDASEFRAFLPVAVVTVFDYAAMVVLCLAAAARLVVAAVTQKGSASQFADVGASAILLAVGGIFVICALYLARKVIRGIPLSLEGHSDALLLRHLIGTRTVQWGAMKVVRILGMDAHALQTLEIVAGERTVLLSARPQNEEGRRFFDQLSVWLRERGAPLEAAGQVVEDSSLWANGAFVLRFSSTLVICIVGAWSITIATAFWSRWLTVGILDPLFVVLLGVPCGIIAGVVLAVGPMRGWLLKLLGFRWLKAAPPLNCHLVIVAEATDSARLLLLRHRSGTIRIVRDVLTLSAGKTSVPIRREEVTRMETVGLATAIRLDTGERVLKHPLRLTWTREDGVVHSVYLTSRHGWSFRRDRILDRLLFDALDRWRQGESETILANLTPGRPVGLVLAALLLIAAIAIPPLHNHLFREYIHTGRWLPPARIRPDYPLGPSQSVVKAVNPEKMLMREYAPEGRKAPASFLGIRRVWFGDPFRGNPRIFNVDLFSVPSHPGGTAHVLKGGIGFDNLMLIPPRKNPFPFMQIVSLETGRARDLTSIPPMDKLWCLALYRDERVFYAVQNEDRNTSSVPIAWLDLRDERVHSLGKIEIESCRSSVFFPAGRHVMLDWKVIDLENGEQKRLTRPATPKGWRYGAFNDFALWMNSFASGERLRAVITFQEDDSATTSMLEQHVWEIDPVAGQIDVIARFPDNTSLKSADGDRWLLAQRIVPGKDDVSLVLYDHDTGTTRTLGQEKAKGYHALVAGKPQMLSWTKKDGWAIRATN